VTRAVEAAGLTTQFLQGQRVTDEATVKLVDEVLSREINPEIVTAIEALGGRARGFAGTEIFRCRKFSASDGQGNPIDLGFVGEVFDVNVAPLRECIRRGITPVVSPTARGEDGRIYNCNADVAAARTAIALWARRLVFMSDVPGLLRDPADANSLMTHLSASEVPDLKASGVIGASDPPAIIASARPLLIIPAASPIECAPVAHAETDA